MRRDSWIIIVVLGSWIVMAVACTNPIPTEIRDQLPEVVDYNFHVRPILSEKCYVCHGPDSSSRQADFRLDNRDAALMLNHQGMSGIVPKKPSKSLIVQRVYTSDLETKMPPPESNLELSDYEKAIIAQWVKQGAPYDPHWSFIPPEPPVDSDIRPTPSEQIDAFIDARLDAQRLTVAEVADKNSLLRRVAFILTGLPPTLEEIELFTFQDTAYDSMVDYYLASPHFGERWARHWMDLMRYAECRGHEFDYPITGAWHYRDYLIRAFNQDLPYSQFVQEHLAGDLITPRIDPETGINESAIATTSYVLSEGKHSPVDTKLEEATWIDNVLDVTSKTFLGLTLSCAKCHDHKFDPIPTTDYHGAYGMVESLRITPRALRNEIRTVQRLDSIQQLQDSIRFHIQQTLSDRWHTISKENQDTFIGFLNSLPKDDLEGAEVPDSILVLGDFRKGSFGDWIADSSVFGKKPAMGRIIPEQRSMRFDSPGFASSQTFASGLTGALRSPNFLIQFDSIQVRVRGQGGLVRVIVDNFQLIQNPLYGSLDEEVDNEEWKDILLDVSMLKGHRAYVEFLPGTYLKHDYQRSPSDFIEVQYVLHGQHPTELPLMDLVKPYESADFDLALTHWLQADATIRDIKMLNHFLSRYPTRRSQSIDSWEQQIAKTANRMIDSVHYMGVTSGPLLQSPIFHRGDINQPTNYLVPHRFISEVSDRAYHSDQTRLEWAQDITRPGHPLTYRVMANRLWHYVFGRGIVETVDNFGLQGSLPTHPQLLDYLALQMEKDGGSIKQMLRHILHTQAFKRSTIPTALSESRDPLNTYWHHYPVRRLEGEAIRDGLLMASGSLDDQLYGSPVPVYLTSFMTGRGRPWESGPLDGDNRRSIYGEIRRNFLPTFQLTFDMPIPFTTFGKRDVTNVPAQSLALLNDPFVHLQSERLAANLLNVSSLDKRIDQAYLNLFARKPQADEVLSAKELIEELKQEHGIKDEDVLYNLELWKSFAHTLINTKEFIFLL